MPQIQAYQEKMTEARLHGNPYESKMFIYFYCWYWCRNLLQISDIISTLVTYLNLNLKLFTYFTWFKKMRGLTYYLSKLYSSPFWIENALALLIVNLQLNERPL